MTVKPAHQVVSQSCKGSRASNLLSANVLYISTIAEKDNCATKVCAYSGSLNNPFPTLDAAQAFYRTQEGSCTAVNPVTYLFMDNGTYGSLVSEYTLCPFENLVAQANNANLIGKFTVDGTGASGTIAQNFTGVNFVGNSSITVKNFVLGALYTLHLQNVIINVTNDRPLLNASVSSDSQDDPVDNTPGVFTTEIGNGGSIYLVFTSVAMKNFGTKDLLAVLGNDATAQGTTLTLSMDDFSGSTAGGIVHKVYSSGGLENVLATYSSNTVLIASSGLPTVAQSAGWLAPASGTPGGTVRSIFQGAVQNLGTGSAFASWAGADSTVDVTLATAVATTAPQALESVYRSQTQANGSVVLDASNSDFISQGGTVLDCLQKSIGGSTSFILNGGTKVVHGNTAPSVNPLVNLTATSGLLQWTSNATSIIANNLPDVFGFIQNVRGTSTYSCKDNGSFFAQTGPGAHLFNLVMNDDGNFSLKHNNGNFSAHSGMIGENMINTTGTILLTSNGNTSSQENESPHPLFRRNIIQGNLRKISNGSVRDAKSTGYVSVLTQSGGKADCTMRNYTLINPNGGGMGYTNLGDAAVANLAALGGQVTVLDTAKLVIAKENATTSYTEVQADMYCPVSIDARTEDNGKLITTLEGVRTSGAVSFAGQGISSTISTCDVKNVLEMIAGNHTISGSVIRTDQGTVSDVDSSVTASQGTTVSIRNTVISNITKNAQNMNIKRALSVNGSSTVSTLSSAISNDVLGQAAVSIGTPGDETDNSHFLASVLEGKSAKDASFAFVNEGASFEGNTLNLSCAERVLDGGGHKIVGSNIFNRTNLQSVPASTSTIQANAYVAK